MHLLLMLACTEETADTSKIEELETGTVPTETGGTGTLPEDLGDPYLAMVAPVPPGFLSFDCVMRAELFSGDDSLGILEIDPVVGGEWAGMALEGDVQYWISAYHSQCNEQTPEETIESGTFSGIAGLLFVYRFNGTNAGVEALEQSVDFRGGLVTITLDTGTDPTQLTTVAATLPATVTTGTEPDTYAVTFDKDLPIGLVLSEIAKVDGFIEGAPDWIDKPGWW